MPDSQATCPNLDNCELQQVFRMRQALEFWIVKYCRSDFAACARLQLSRNGQPVPRTMLPNGQFLTPRR